MEFPDVIMASGNRKIEDDDSDLLFRKAPTLVERIILQPIRRKRCQDSGRTHLPTVMSTLQAQAELHQIKLIVDRRMKDLIYSEVPATRLPVAFG